MMISDIGPVAPTWRKLWCQVLMGLAVISTAMAQQANHLPVKAVRYVVANPSSYLWFGDVRPRPTCPGQDLWRYGLHDAPSYVGDTKGIEERFIRRGVVCLLGALDTNPAHPDLDRSCAAEAQGETRFARGMPNMPYLEQRHPNLVQQRIFAIPDVGHDGGRMFASVCGMAALFDRPGCPGF